MKLPRFGLRISFPASKMMAEAQAWRPDVGFVVALKYKHVPYGQGPRDRGIHMLYIDLEAVRHLLLVLKHAIFIYFHVFSFKHRCS